jgi:hypothetical protein
LLNKYLQLNGKIIGFNIDTNINNCLYGLLLVNISDIPFAILENLGKEFGEMHDPGRKRSEILDPQY